MRVGVVKDGHYEARPGGDAYSESAEIGFFFRRDCRRSFAYVHVHLRLIFLREPRLRGNKPFAANKRKSEEGNECACQTFFREELKS